MDTAEMRAEAAKGVVLGWKRERHPAAPYVAAISVAGDLVVVRINDRDREILDPAIVSAVRAAFRDSGVSPDVIHECGLRARRLLLSRTERIVFWRDAVDEPRHTGCVLE